MKAQYLDWIIIIGYLGFVFFLAIKSHQSVSKNPSTKNVSAEEKFLANKSLTFTESIFSIIATEVSALTFLGIPAFAYSNNYTFIQIYFGAIIGRLFIAKLFLPKIYGQGLTIYEVMAKDPKDKHRFKNFSGRRSVALFYLISKILSVGVRLFSGSILISQFLSLNIYLALIIITLVTFLYTLIGGLKAVVRTDILQTILFILGGVLAHFLIPTSSQSSWMELMTIAHKAGKTSFFSWENPWPFIIGIMGGILFDMSTHGVDQDFTQRMTANKTLKGGQLAIFFSSFISISIGLLFLGVGSLLWAHFKESGLPTGVDSPDHLFAYYITHYFPVGVRGLMVAGVLAATMSTLDSTINALSATLYNDIFPQRNPKHIESYSLIDNLIISSLLLLVAMISSSNQGLLLFGLKIQSWTGGPLLAIFFARVLLKRWFDYDFKPMSVVGAYLLGFLGVYLNSFVLKWNWNFNIYWGCLLALIFLKYYSFLSMKNSSAESIRK